MKKADRDRLNIANSEITQSCVLLKLGARALLDLHERHPLHRSTVKTWVEAHRRWHEEQWDVLLGKVLASEILSASPIDRDDMEVRAVLDSIIAMRPRLEQSTSAMRDILQTRPELRPWAMEVMEDLRKWFATLSTDFGRAAIAAAYVDRLDKLGRPDPIGSEPGEAIRALEPQPKLDSEYLAWIAEHPEDRIEPKAGPEDFVAEHPDGSVTRIRDIIPLYRSGTMERPWGLNFQTWDQALVHDLILARSAAVRRVSISHLQWWLAPLRSVVENMERDCLVDTAKAMIVDMMSAAPMQMTSLPFDGWLPTHHGRAIVVDRMIPQWLRVSQKGGQL
jgi:hypothetical protein